MLRYPDGRELKPPVFLKRLGCSLLVAALTLLMVLTATTATSRYTNVMAAYSYGLILMGAVLVVINMGLEWRHRQRVRNLSAHCVKCGWKGVGAQWLRSECCPECDNEDVTVSEAAPPGLTG
jgi:hypothetical protein